MLKALRSYLSDRPIVLYVVAALLLIPALFINLGLGAIMADEPTRALVALEMIISDNFITPTLFGDFYYKKPPLFNWILVGLYFTNGHLSELLVRLAAVVPLFFYGGTIFLFVRKYLDWKVGFFTAMMFITNGRMLIYDSFIGHIDIFYSWLTYMSFVAMFYFFHKKQWLLLFVISYFLAGLGFLSKGLPSLVFQGFSLLALFIYYKKFVRLFYWQHFVGLGVLLLILGSYFYAYSQHNSLIDYFNTLWTESSQRTVAERNWISSITHLFTFPFELFGYHILPWSLLFIYVFSRKFWKEVKENAFLTFNVLILGANIIVYWLSPATHPRYLFMLYPLFFALLAYGALYYHSEDSIAHKWLYYLFGGICVAATLGMWTFPFIDVIKDMSYVWIKACILFITMGLTTYLYWTMPKHSFVLFCIFLLLFRISFNWFILTHRYETGIITQYKLDGLKVGEMTKGEKLYVKEGEGMEVFNHDLAYYITRERMEILPKKEEIVPDVFYICSDSQLMMLDYDYECHYGFVTRHHHTPVNLVKFK